MNIQHRVELRSIEEKYDLSLQAEQITDYLAQLKGKAFQDNQLTNQIVITADTIVWFEGNALGKPKNETIAKQMLLSISGKTHRVISSVCFTTLRQQHDSLLYRCKVYRFKRRYCCTTVQLAALDKAGSYGIQDTFGLYAVEEINGSYTNVMGLPCMQTYKALEKLVQAFVNSITFQSSRNFFLLKSILLIAC